MNRLAILSVLAVVVIGIVGFVAGYELHQPPTPRPVPVSIVLWGRTLSCGPSNQPPYLEGALQFNLTSTYWNDAIASVGYTGNWTGDTNQLVHANSTKHVIITWGPGANQSIMVTTCPTVGVVIWRVVQTFTACPNPPCDDGTIPAP